MNANNRNTALGKLADEADAFKDVSYDSPKVGLWKNRARKFVGEEFGEDYVEILNRALFFRFVISSPGHALQMHHKAMDDAAIFLRELQSEPSTAEEVAVSAPDDDALLRLDDLHPRIVKGCAELYRTGHLAEAVEKSFKIVRARLRQLTGYETGSDAFGKGDLRVRGAIDEYVEDEFNEAVKFLTMAIDRFRNEKAHTADAHIDEHVRAAEYLAMSSLAMRFLDGGYIKP